MLNRIFVAVVATFLALPAQAQQTDPNLNPDANNHEYTLHKFAVGGFKTQLNFFYSIKADCTPTDWMHVEITKEAEHGVSNVVDADVLPAYAAPNPRVRCNDKAVRARALEYTPTESYQGSDSVIVEIIDSYGNRNVWKFELTVR